MSEAPETFGSIFVEAAQITSEGITAGTERRIFQASTAQLRNLVRLVETDGLAALTVMIEFGVLKVDPLRIEGPFTQRWLADHGMTYNQAKRGLKKLRDVGMVTDAEYPDPRGACGGKWQALAGERFGWSRVSKEALIEGGRAYLQSKGRLVEPAKELVGTATTPTTRKPVDNPVGTETAPTTERPTHLGRWDGSRPNVAAEFSQVTALGQVPTQRLSTAPSSKEVEEKEVLLLGTQVEGVPLTRDHLLNLVWAPEVARAFTAREADAVAHLTRVLQARPDSATAALVFLGLPETDDPSMGLATFVHQLITADPTQQIDYAAALRTRFKSQRARISPDLTAKDILSTALLLSVVTQDSPPRDWRAVTVWLSKSEEAPDFESSRSVRALVDTINTLVFSPATPSSVPSIGDRAGDTATPTGMEVFGSPSSSVRDRPLHEVEALRRGEDYWAWMQREVLPGTDWDDVYGIQTVRGNTRLQNMLISGYYRNQGEAPPAF